MKLTDGRGVDVILEMLANVNLAKDLTVLAKNGRVIVVGNRGTIEINPRDGWPRTRHLGVTLMNADADPSRLIHAALVAGLENGTLRPVVRQELPLEGAPRGTRVLEPGSYGKIILVP